MKRFTFSLSSLLSVREGEKDQALQAYAKAMKNRVEMEKHYRAEEEKFHAYERELTESMRGAVHPQMHAQRVQSLQEGQVYLSQLAAAVKGFKNREQNLLCSLIEAKNNLDILEKLKSRRKEKHRLSAMRKEEIEMEDIMNARRYVP